MKILLKVLRLLIEVLTYNTYEGENIHILQSVVLTSHCFIQYYYMYKYKHVVQSHSISF